MAILFHPANPGQSGIYLINIGTENERFFG